MYVGMLCMYVGMVCMYVGMLCMYVGILCMYVGMLCMYVGMLFMYVGMLYPMNAIQMFKMLCPRVLHSAWLRHCIRLGFVVSSNTVALFPGPHMYVYHVPIGDYCSS